MFNIPLTASMMELTNSEPLSERRTAGNPATSKKTEYTRNFAHSSAVLALSGCTQQYLEKGHSACAMYLKSPSGGSSGADRIDKESLEGSLEKLRSLLSGESCLRFRQLANLTDLAPVANVSFKTRPPELRAHLG